jgi:hypothetical protein
VRLEEGEGGAREEREREKEKEKNKRQKMRNGWEEVREIRSDSWYVSTAS